MLPENSLFVKVEKCEFHASTLTFLGYVAAEGSLQMDSAKVSAPPRLFLTPANSSNASWVSLTFTTAFFGGSSVAAPLMALNSSKVPFHWNPAAEAALSRQFQDGDSGKDILPTPCVVATLTWVMEERVSSYRGAC